jgi:hypothetical protein
MACCESLVYLPSVFIDYRLRLGSITCSSVSEKKCLDRMSALLPVKLFYKNNNNSHKIRLSFDKYACFVYLNTLKMSYQLPILLGNGIRVKLKALFLEILFNNYQVVLEDLERGDKLHCRAAYKIRLIMSYNKKIHYKMMLFAIIKKLKNRKIHRHL